METGLPVKKSTLLAWLAYLGLFLGLSMSSSDYPCSWLVT